MITITFGTWMIPTAITALGLIWALFIVKDSPGYFSGLSNLFALIPVLFVSCIAWILWGVFK
jgi:hypothetical protein